MPLTDREIRNLKPQAKPYKVFDGGGLHLLVKPTDKKYWRLKYRLNGKENSISLGTYPKVSLKEAREQLVELKRKIEQGINPSIDKKTEKHARVEEGNNTFAKIAHEWFAVKIKNKSKSHRTRTLRMIEKELLPKLGNYPINKITPPLLLSVLRDIEERGVVDTAHRAKQVAGLICRYAIITGRAERDPSADLIGALQSHSKTHYPSITKPEDVAKLYKDIKRYRGSPSICYALKLTPLLMCRPGELRKLEWEDIDFNNAQIEISAEKMKMRSSHIIPLSTQALALLKEARNVNHDSRYVFPTPTSKYRPISDNGVRTALRIMGYDNGVITPHGFRAMARTMLDEVLHYPVEWIEHQLAHTVKDPLGRAYNRTKHLPQRKVMMQGWADYLDWLVGQLESKSFKFDSYNAVEQSQTMTFSVTK